MRAPVPSIAWTYRAVSVATPDRWPRKLSATRSPARIQRAEPATSATRPPSRHSPSCTCACQRSSGSRRRNTDSAACRPQITPGAFCSMRARARAFSGTVARLVTSPFPRSSRSARSISSCITAQRSSGRRADPSRGGGLRDQLGQRGPAGRGVERQLVRVVGREPRADDPHLVHLVRRHGVCAWTCALENRGRALLELPERRQRPPVAHAPGHHPEGIEPRLDRKSTRLNSSHMSTSYAVFCLKKKTAKFPENF